jgi:C-terminal processing protease CtpA/Prc
VPRIGITTQGSEEGVQIVDVTPGGTAGVAGVRPDDILVRVADIPVEDNSFGEVFRNRFSNQPAGTAYQIVVRRDGQDVTLSAVLEFAEVTTSQLVEDASASEKAVRIREGILTGG